MIKRNTTSGIVKYLFKIFLPFALKTVIQYVLGAKYLGLNGLFTSIISVLNLTELGFSNIVVYRLYRPIAEGDNKVVCGYITYLKHIYRICGFFILSIGILIVPFITYIIQGDYPDDTNLHILFMIYLVNASSTYFFGGYKQAILNAEQRIDVINRTETIVMILQNIVQIISLIAFRNYYVYILLTPVFTTGLNIFLSYKTNKLFPEFIESYDLRTEKKKALLSDIRGIAIYKISEVTRNSFDNIILSMFLGLTMVAIFNNYFYIFNALYSFMLVLNLGLKNTIGSSIAIRSVDENYDDFKLLSFISICVTTIFSCCLLNLYQVFMRIWMGSDMLLGESSVILFSVYFYVLNMNNIKNLYYDGNGLWNKGKLSFILEAFLNLFLNIVLGKKFGVSGILVATIISLFICSFLWRSTIVFREYFGRSVKPYFIFNFKMCLQSILVFIISHYICELVSVGGILGFIVIFIVCVTISISFIVLCNYSNPILNESLRYIKNNYKGNERNN